MIYFHIPFCKQKCSYCNFHFSTLLKTKEQVLEQMKYEFFLRKNELTSKTIESIYFGGGTPSILSIDELQSFIDLVAQHFEISNTAEITLEANPDDLNREFLTQLTHSQINRLSIGIQSFNDEDLILMNRAHNAIEGENAVKRAQDIGFENISIDLIYGSPKTGLAELISNIEKTAALDVPHVSAYALSIEPKTALNNWINLKKIPAVNDTIQAEAFYILSDYFQTKAYVHYEISNLAKKGKRAIHNTAYWQRKEYLGIGPSAHSYNGNKVRSWNINNNTQYIKNLQAKKLPTTYETLTEIDVYNERMMLGLRTVEGILIEQIQNDFSEIISKNFERVLSNKLITGEILIIENQMKIPKNRWFLADGIISDFFFTP